MALPVTRDEFGDFCLRRLGEGVIDINVSNTHVEDCIDFGLSFYADYHFDGSEQVYITHELTANNITDKSIPISNTIIGITDIFDIGSSFSTNNMFNIRYQYALNDLFNFTNFDLANYSMTREYINLLEEVLVGMKPIRFNRHTNILHIDMNWNLVVPGQFIIAKGYASVDPTTYVDVWKDRWLIDYVSTLIEEVWGRGLSKYEGVQLPGGITLNGQQILDRAQGRRQQLEDEVINKYSLPPVNMYG